MDSSASSDHEKKAKGGWFQSLRKGLVKTSTKLTEGLTQILTQRPLSDSMLLELEELLISADISMGVTQKLLSNLRAKRYDQNTTLAETQGILADHLEKILLPYECPLPLPKIDTPFVVLMVGVNGSGKTTTTAKLATFWAQQGYRPLLIAADTFRAGAVKQLEIWAQRGNFSFFTKEGEKDSASLCYDGLKYAQDHGHNIVLIDTAGRLHTNSNLMEELTKVSRVLKKADPSAPHLTLLVLDATTGQNTYQQLKVFQEKVSIDSLIVSKLDGTSKGGVIVGLCDQFKIPIMAIGCGETDQDLLPFNAQTYAHSLVGL